MQHRLLSLLVVVCAATAVLSEVTLKMNYDAGTKSRKYDVKGSITIDCTATVTDNEKITFKWEKGDYDIKSDEKRVTVTAESSSSRIKITKALEEDAGVYECFALVNNVVVASENITLISKYRVKTPDNLNQVEGDEMRIHCQVYGKPAPNISWQKDNETYETSRDRITLERDEAFEVDNAILVIKDVQMDERGTYKCIARSEAGTELDTDTTEVRIKDKYAALWPFLGICAEVFILCAIILIYEKKRNKAELEESDTDQSPDQKNTPDHGKDSNLRHRQ